MGRKRIVEEQEVVPICGREEEIRVMKKLLQTKESELLAVYGRRRVGKSFLIKKVYKKEIVYKLEGDRNASNKEQLQNFIDNINDKLRSKRPLPAPKNWNAAFKILQTYITGLRVKHKKVIFFDELPWISKPKSGFLKAFEYFWNSWAVDQNIIIVICGSAASWIIDNVLDDKGGLHNRVTKKIQLMPFTLYETEKYLKSRKINFSRYEIVQLYMVLGGVPFYLREVENGSSAAKEIDRICFGTKAPLKNEFDNLFKALFINHQHHTDIVKALAKKKKGLTRNELVTSGKITTGGTLTKVLKELELSHFITTYKPFGKQERDTLYRLTDEYSLFYLSFIEKNGNTKGFWYKQTATPTYNTWGGFSFESLCLKHIESIKYSLSIAGIYSESSSFYFGGNDSIPGFQMDMIIDRLDNVINICEMKFYNKPFIITKKEADNIRLKLAYFQHFTKTRKRLVFTLISNYGLANSIHNDIVEKSLTIDGLFLNEEF